VQRALRSTSYRHRRPQSPSRRGERGI